MRHTIIAFLCLVVLLVAGCGSVTNASTSGSVTKTPTITRNEPNGLRIVLTDLLGDGGYDTVYATYTIHNAVEAQDLYKAVETLPLAPKVTLCPMDYGYRYHVTFLHDNVKVLHELVVSPDGCRFVYFTPKDVRIAFGKEAFWKLFGHILGVPENQVFSTPTPTP